MTTSYRTSHVGKDRTKSYVGTYTRGYYAGQWQDVEKPLLETVFARIRDAGATDLLDFAAGTGRITAVAANYFPNVTAVDISADMLACVPSAKNVRTVCRDITVDPLDEQFDVCTAFRFFLNAEPQLRTAAMDAIRACLRPGGTLVCNIHMVSSSPMGLAYRAIDSLGLKAHQYLGVQDFRDLLQHHGFEIESERAYGYLPRPGWLMPKLMQSLAGPVERYATRLSAPEPLAQSRLFIAKKRKNGR